MKPTAFNAIHRSLGGKLIDFAGFEMPVQYSGIIEEHRCVRSAVGMFDVSHMGEVLVKGPDALAFVQFLTTNDASKLFKGKVQYSAMCYEDGGIVDDLLVYSFGGHFMLVINASNTAKDIAWIRSHASKFDVEVIDQSDDLSLLAVQGPSSLKTLQGLTSANLSDLPYYSFVEGELAGIEMIISRTGYTGELGFELYFDSSVAAGEKVWRAIMAAGQQFGIKPVGLGARDTLRLEMGFCLYGNDIDQTTHPLEAGLGWITKLNKGNFSGRDALLRAKEAGLKRMLTPFEIREERAFPRHGYEIQSGGKPVGHVTSGTLSPVLDKGIGLGYVDRGGEQTGTTLDIMIRNKPVAAVVRSLPFVHAK
jgi:aminomethyltransferase